MVGIVAALALFGAAPLVAQYFGQNKVQYQSFDFRIIQTEHFEVYYYPAERAAALDGARMAERWYARLSRVLHHQFQGRKPIIFYASQSDFQQTNTTSEDIGEGTGGFTEFFKHRMVLPFTGAYEELEHVIGHEMVHQFQYDVFSRGRIGAGVQTLVNVAPPLWFMEGMAEYLSMGPIDPLTAMWLRDASVEGHLPTIEELTYDQRIFPYYFGHALWAYIGEKWGDEAVGQILQASTAAGVEGAFKRTLGLSLDDLSHEWRDAVQTTYLPQLADHYRARPIPQPPLPPQRSRGPRHHAVLVPRRESARVHGLRRRHLGPVRRQRRRLRAAPAHQRQVRRPPAILGPRRQDDRLRHRSWRRHRFRRPQVRQHADRPVPPRQGHDRRAGAHGSGEEHQPRLGARRKVARVRLRPQWHQQHLPVRLRRREHLPAHRCVYGRVGYHPAVALSLLGARGRPARLRLL